MKLKLSQPKTIKGKVFLVLAIILFILFSIVLIQRIYRYYNPQSLITYKIYEPTYLPDGLTINERILRYETPDLLWWVKPEVSVSARAYAGDNYVSIYNIATTDEDIDSCNTGSNSDSGSCEMHTSPGGVLYKRTLGYIFSDPNTRPLVYDLLISEGVSFVRGGTLAGFSMPRDDHQPLSVEELDKIVDSFQEVSINDYDILHTHPGP